MNTIIYLILIMFFLDIIFTYVNINKYRKLFPKKDYKNLELNPIPKVFWKLLGLFWGGIISTAVQLCLISIFIEFFSIESLYTLFGVYITMLLIHLDNFNLINNRKREKEKTKKKNNWRKYAFILLLVISFVDLATTYYYISNYISWRPDVPYNLMEANPLLLFLWNNLGLLIGTLFGGIIIWFLLYLVGIKAHWLIVLIVMLSLLFGCINNINHINQLQELIKLYPLGHL